MKASVALTSRSFLLRLAVAMGIVLFFTLAARAGGPRRVAGTAYFDPSVAGTSLSWAQGSVVYYTDRGDLSPALPNASANNLVAAGFNQWAVVQTAALQTTSGGQLAEDINGTNVTRNSDGTISVPPDIQSTATGTPVGVVYDNDGTVTDALLGTGASTQCFSNAVFGGTDNYGSLATYRHALIVINGLCAQQSSQLPDVQYRLLQVIGSILGVGWSQANVNVLTGSPHPTSDDFAGFPLMHPTDPLNCVPTTRCYPNPAQLSLDDVAAISRLYPVTAQNQASFPGKQVLGAATARIHGSVWFADAHGNRTQPMQGVNVVARWIDPTTGQPSRRYVATSVSGFLFCGNDGNPITGSDDAVGDPLEEWGSDDQNLEGFFDLAGLPLPNGGSAQYQLSVEALDPRWSASVGPYSPGPVSPSGSFQPITVTVSAGSDVQQDILMRGSARPLTHSATSWITPVALSKNGNWISTLNNYDEVDYFALQARANRTLSVAVTALDESGQASEFKLQPVIGMWAASDPQGTSPPAFTASPFNATSFAMTRLDAQVLTNGNFLIGISDIRGDGRPDYRYHAHVLYADTVAPWRIGASGGVITVHGSGFAPGLTAMIGNHAATQLAVSASQMILSAPASSDGPQNITISDPVSGAFTTMTNALLYGAAADDNLVLLTGVALSTPVGTQATSPITVRVFAADGVSPVDGATIGWSATNAVQLSACGGSSYCSVVTDENGYAATWVTPGVAGSASITATLAPGVYTPAKSVSVSVTATQTASDIGALTPYLWISQGATAAVPLTARALSNGKPLSNTQVNFAIESGTGTLSASSAPTNSNGYVGVTLTVTQMAALVRVSACIAPAMTRCAIYYANPVPIAQQYLQPVAGAGQVSSGQPLQPVVVRVVDGSSPPNPVIAAPVAFRIIVLRPGGTVPSGGDGETTSGSPAMPVILKSADSNATSDVNGLASIAPSSGGFSPPVEIDIRASGGSTALDFPIELLAPLGSNAAEAPPSTLNQLRRASQRPLLELEERFLRRMKPGRTEP